MKSKKKQKGGSGSLYTSPRNNIGEILPKTPLGNSSTNPTKKQDSTHNLPFNRE